MSERTSLSKKARFEVFKRDSFTCQYCGRKAPDVILHVDHISPVSKGGGDDLLNLITSCLECNLGKGARLLSDDSAIAKQRRQLEELQERREQLDMMLEWQRSLVDLDTDTTKRVAALWSELVPGWHLNEGGHRGLRKLIRKYGVEEVATAMRIAAEQYLQFDDTGKPKDESVERAWQKVGGICGTRRTEKDKPYIRELLYIRGILRRRIWNCREDVALELLEDAYLEGVHIDDLKRLAKTARNWSGWQSNMYDWIAEVRRERQEDGDG